MQTLSLALWGRKVVSDRPLTQREVIERRIARRKNDRKISQYKAK